MSLWILKIYCFCNMYHYFSFGYLASSSRNGHKLLGLHHMKIFSSIFWNAIKKWIRVCKNILCFLSQIWENVSKKSQLWLDSGWVGLTFGLWYFGQWFLCYLPVHPEAWGYRTTKIVVYNCHFYIFKMNKFKKCSLFLSLFFLV